MKRTKIDMTQGAILPALLSYAFPLMLGSLFQDLYHVADMSIAGHTMGDSALAAISSTGVITTLINPMLNGFCIGSSVQISNRFGEKNHAMARRCIAAMSILCVCMMIAVTSSALLLLEPILDLVKIPGELREEASDYIRVILLGIPATILYDLFACTYRAVGDSKIPLIVLIFSAFTNTGLDYLFIVPFQMGVRGAAVATVVSQIAAAILAWLFFVRRYPELKISREDVRGCRQAMGDMLPYGVSGAFTNSVFAIGAAAIQGTVNSLGAEVIVSQAASSKIKSFAMIPSAALSNAAATFSAQNFGAHKIERIRKGVHTVIGCGIVCTAVLYVLIRIFGEASIRLITDTQNPTILEQARTMLFIAIPFILFQTAVMSYRMSVQGMCRKLIPILGMAIELVIRCTFAFAVTPVMGYRAIAWSEPASWIIGAASMGTAFYLILRKEQKKRL